MLAHCVGIDRLVPSSGYVMSDWAHDETRLVDHVIGAFYLIRRDVFERLGGFDERFFVYLEDLDLSQRVRAAGGKCMYAADAIAHHVGGGTTQSIKSTRLFYSVRSRLQFSSKHFGFASNAAVWLASVTIEPLVRSARAGVARVVDGVDRGVACVRPTVPVVTAMTRVLALPRYTHKGASSRLRTLQYIGELSRRGIDFRLESLLDDVYLDDLYAGRRTQWRRLARAYARRASLRGMIGTFDVVWLEKEAFPWLPGAAERLLLDGTPTVVDYDDAIFHRYDQHPSRWVCARCSDARSIR
jgi:hypothetical protein